MSFLGIPCIAVGLLWLLLPLARAATVTAAFTSASAVPVTEIGYSAVGKDLSLSLGFAPPGGTALTVVKNTGIGFIIGRFSNLAQGQVVNLAHGGVTYRFIANYHGGTGNDLVLQWGFQTASTWGLNTSGQLGNNSTIQSKLPVAVKTSGALSGKSVLAVAGGHSHSLALCSDGTVTAWGLNTSGQLGNGTTTNSTVPVTVVNTGTLATKTVIAIAAGAYHSLALCSDGTVAAWGSSSNGQLGNGSSSYSSSPVSVTHTGALSGRTVVAVAAGDSHSLALCSDGTLAAWGDDNSGQLGNSSSGSSNVPVLVTRTGVLSGKTVVAISAGLYHSLARCSDGVPVAWGANGAGQLGIGTTGQGSEVPMLVTRTGGLAGKYVIALAGGYNHTLAANSDSTAAGWGSNSSAQLGNGGTTSSSLAVSVTKSGALSGKTPVAMAAGETHSLTLCSDGTLAAWEITVMASLETTPPPPAIRLLRSPPRDPCLAKPR